MLHSNHFSASKEWKPKTSPHKLQYTYGVIIVVDNNYNLHWYLDNESVYFINVAFLNVFLSIWTWLEESDCSVLEFFNRSTTMLNSGFKILYLPKIFLSSWSDLFKTNVIFFVYWYVICNLKPLFNSVVDRFKKF